MKAKIISMSLTDEHAQLIKWLIDNRAGRNASHVLRKALVDYATANGAPKNLISDAGKLDYRYSYRFDGTASDPHRRRRP